tara:strand:- start:324 stop:632 length:309 start_codon:yes stop_codon:yes gene_type:complete
MKNFKLYTLITIIIFISSCGTLKEGFSNQKKNNNDEFLVEKKLPLVMPPDYNELPFPKEQNKKDENNIELLITNSNNIKVKDNVSEKNKSFEESLLKKIKEN